MTSRSLTFAYAGNRSTVLRAMLKAKLSIRVVLPVVGSWLHREAEGLGIPYVPISSRNDVIAEIERSRVDVFVSTGLPHILPIARLRGTCPGTRFVNVHPSLLPDLRGADPIPAAILFRRDTGVTCHIMDDGIDTGPIICQQEFPYFDGLDSRSLYHFLFQMEPDVFTESLKLNFEPQHASAATRDLIYYSFTPGDLELRFSDSDADLLSRVRAFNTPNKGVRFSIEDTTFRVFAADTVSNTVVLDHYSHFHHNSIVGIFEDSILVKRASCLLRLSQIQPPPNVRLLGRIIDSPTFEHSGP